MRTLYYFLKDAHHPYELVSQLFEVFWKFVSSDFSFSFRPICFCRWKHFISFPSIDVWISSFVKFHLFCFLFQFGCRAENLFQQRPQKNKQHLLVWKVNERKKKSLWFMKQKKWRQRKTRKFFLTFFVGDQCRLNEHLGRSEDGRTKADSKPVSEAPVEWIQRLRVRTLCRSRRCSPSLSGAGNSKAPNSELSSLSH